MKKSINKKKNGKNIKQNETNKQRKWNKQTNKKTKWNTWKMKIKITHTQKVSVHWKANKSNIY